MSGIVTRSKRQLSELWAGFDSVDSRNQLKTPGIKGSEPQSHETNELQVKFMSDTGSHTRDFNRFRSRIFMASKETDILTNTVEIESRKRRLFENHRQQTGVKQNKIQNQAPAISKQRRKRRKRSHRKRGRSSMASRRSLRVRALNRKTYVEQSTDSEESVSSESEALQTEVEASVQKYKKAPLIPAFEAIVGKKIDPQNPEDPLYLLKWKDRAYIHCSFHPASVICDGGTNKRAQERVARFERNLEMYDLPGAKTKEQLFPNEYKQVERIIGKHIENMPESDSEKEEDSTSDSEHSSSEDEAEIENNAKGNAAHISEDNKLQPVHEYMVKWCSLPYDECTWECEKDIPFASEMCKSLTNEWQQYQQDVKQESLADRFNSYRSEDNTDVQIQVEGAAMSQSSIIYTLKTNRLDTSPAFGREHENSLRDYQLEGVNWLINNWKNGTNSILADEMGLGKTMQVVVFLWYLKAFHNLRGPHLVLAPLVTLPHWHRAIERWTSLYAVTYNGNKVARRMIRKYELRFRDEQQQKITKRNMYKAEVLITSYEMLMKDVELLKDIQWQSLIVDEAHRLKNQSSKLFKALCEHTFASCIMLTGTPIQNNIKELWTLLYFLQPDRIEPYEEFESKYGTLETMSQLKALHKVLRPCLLRRLKCDVELTVPPKQELIIEVELTPLQAQYYKAVYEKNIHVLQKSSVSTVSLMNVAMQLRKCCNHPYLLDGSEECVTIKCGATTGDKIMNCLVKSSGKMILLDKLLPHLQTRGHRVLLFSQMVRILDILEDYLRWRKYKYERIDGQVQSSDRQMAIDRFNKDPSRFVFLLGTRAGGLGINLASADTVIIYDSDWNPQNDMQSQARCHRIGQTEEVKVYRLVTRDSYEMQMLHRASMKLGLDQAVLHNANQNQSTAELQGDSDTTERMVKEETSPDEATKEDNLTECKAGHLEERTVIDGCDSVKESSRSAESEKQQLENMLKHGAYEIFKTEATKPEKFGEEDIESILCRSKESSSYQKSVSGFFSKAYFQTKDENGSGLLNDPQFWSNLGIEDKSSESYPVQLSFQRRRVATKHYGYDDEEYVLDEKYKAKGNDRQHECRTRSKTTKPTTESVQI